MNIVAWLKAKWRDPGQRAQVIHEYAALGQMRHLQADIAHRGYVFTVPQPAPADFYQAGVIEGRRQLALELIRAAGTDPAMLQKLCFEPLKREG